MEDMSEPPVPANADLKDFAFTPIYRARLFGSAFHARATDAEWRAGVTLWLKSQDQSPAGSLPDDDTELCRLAELGRDIRTWKKIRAGALHGWYMCSDGRLYNVVVAEVVNEQWERRLADKERKEKWRQKKASQRGDITSPSPGTNGGCPPGKPAMSPGTTNDVPGESALKGQGQGQGQGHLPPTAPPQTCPPDRVRQQRGTTIPEAWSPRDEDFSWALAEHGVERERAKQITVEFIDHWLSVSGSKATHACWWRTWRNRIRQLAEQNRLNPNGANGHDRPSAVDKLRIGAARAVQAVLERDREREQSAEDRRARNPADGPLLDGKRQHGSAADAD